MKQRSPDLVTAMHSIQLVEKTTLTAANHVTQGDSSARAKQNELLQHSRPVVDESVSATEEVTSLLSGTPSTRVSYIPKASQVEILKGFSIIHDQGRILYDQKEYESAEALLKHAVEGRQKFLGRDSQLTLDSMTALASVFYCQSRYADVELLLQVILGARRKILGPKHGDTIHSAVSLVQVWRKLGKDPEADAMFEEIAKISERGDMDAVDETFKAYNELADAYKRFIKQAKGH